MSDPRFARLKTDPRFRRPKKQQAKVVVDERFKQVFQTEKKKGKSGRVDKYGRPISSTHEQDNLKRFYQLENGDEADADETPRIPDLARGEVLLESSDEEDDIKEDDDGDVDDIVTVGAGPSKPISIPRDEDLEIDLDEDNFADLEKQAEEYARQNPDEDVDEGEHTKRIAIVNLDWDHVRAAHLYKICASLVSPTAPISTIATDSGKKRSSGSANTVRGKVLSVCIYPSQFGKDRMAKEEKEGPPPEIFKRPGELDEDELNEQNIYELGDENEYDEDALRKYQLERLRYYYAIVTCDTVNAASHIYNELQGTELERSANVFDLSFVPDDMTFDDDPRDEANEDAESYKAVEFVTDALRHSKVKLTWDEDDQERIQITRRTLTRKELEEADFKAYIASSSSEGESEAEPSAKKYKKGKKRDKLRALLLGGNNEDMPEGWGDGGDEGDVDMEITFTPGLSEKKSEEDETTLERYQRKMKEKRRKRKDEVKEKSIEKGEKGKSLDDDFFQAGSGEEDEDNGIQKKSMKKRDGKTEDAERHETTAEELALLAVSDNPNAEPQHFNLKSVVKAEKKSRKGRKGKKGKPEEDNEVQEDFVINVKDDRFKVLYEDHQFAIDPSNPHFKKTKSMSALLDERRRRRHTADPDNETVSTKSKPANTEKSLQSLVESVKRKSANMDTHGSGKRRKL